MREQMSPCPRKDLRPCAKQPMTSFQPIKRSNLLAALYLERVCKRGFRQPQNILC